jgi:hypothetical protein
MQQWRRLMHNRHARNEGHLGLGYGELIFEVRWSTWRANLTSRLDRLTAPNTRQTLARQGCRAEAQTGAGKLALATHCCSPKGSRGVVDVCRQVLVHDRLPGVALVLVPPAHSG